MATAKKSSAKKLATKKKTAAARTTAKKTTAKKPAAKQAAAVKNQPKRMITLEKLRKFHFFTAAVNAVFAVLSVVFLSNKVAELYLPYSTKDELASLDSTVLGPAYELIATVELRYILAFIFGLGAIFSLLLATSLRAKYEAAAKAKVSGLRWIFIGLISALLLEFVSLIGGVTDIVTLKLIAGLVLIAFLLGWVTENRKKAGGVGLAAFYTGLLAGVLAWVPLLTGLIGTSLLGMQTFGWHVYVLAALLLLGFLSFSMTQLRFIKSSVDAEGYLQVEGKYISTNFLISVAFFMIVFVAYYN